MRPSVDDLMRADNRVRTYKQVAAALVIGPGLLVAFEHPHEFVRQYIDTMLFAFSWPLLTLLVLYIMRRRFLLRLAQEGRECRGVVQSWSSARGARWTTARVLVNVEGQEKVVDADVPNRIFVVTNREVTILLDPIKKRKAVVLAAVDA